MRLRRMDPPLRENLTMPTNDLFGSLLGLYALIFLVLAFLLGSV